MRRSSAIVVCAAALLAGCSSKLDVADTEQAITASVARRFGVTVRAVDCPAEVRAKAGATFRCTVRAADGSSGVAVVTQEDDRGHVRARTPFLDIRGIERDLSRGLEEQSGARRVRVSCPDIVRVDAGESFRCRARTGGRRTRLKVVQGADGRVRLQSRF